MKSFGESLAELRKVAQRHEGRQGQLHTIADEIEQEYGEIINLYRNKSIVELAQKEKV